MAEESSSEPPRRWHKLPERPRPVFAQPIKAFTELPPVQYVREPEPPPHFPSSLPYLTMEGLVPEGYAHILLRTFLFGLLQHILGDAHCVNSDQLVYWDPKAPKRCLAPDVCVRLNEPQSSASSWKTWERGGPPELAVEIVSPNEYDGIRWSDKFERYQELGVRELVCFDLESPPGSRIRAWDRVDGHLVERQVKEDVTPCATLGLVWAVRPIKKWPEALRLIDGSGGLVLNEAEAADQAREAATKAREAEAKAREAAEARVRELEEEIQRLRSR